MKPALLFILILMVSAVARANPAPAASQWWENSFDADIYPSAQSAAWAVGRRWGADLAAKLENPPAAIHIMTSRQLDATVTENLLQGLGVSIERAHIHIIFPKSTAPQWLEGMVLSATLNSGDPAKKEGSIELVNSTPSSPPLRAIARYRDKPWAENLSIYLEKQSNKERIVVDSGNPQPTAQQATAAAAWAATDVLMPLLRTRLASRQATWSDHNDHALRTMLHAELSARHYTKDVFIQSFARPYGTVWREAMLIDTSSDNINKITSDFARRFDQRRKAVWATAGSVLGVLLSTYILYAILNSFTKGYFTGSLRLAAAVVAVILLLPVVIYFIRTSW